MNQVKIDSVSSVEKKLSIQIPEASVQEELNQAYKQLKNQARIPGFRPGKAPRDMLEKKYGPSVESDVYQSLIRSSVSEALDSNDLFAINVREVSEPKREEGKGFSYVVWVEVKPEIKLKNYTGLKIKSAVKKITDKEVTASLDHLRDSQAVLKDKEKAISPKKGDFVGIEVEPLIADPNSKTEPQQELYEFQGAHAQKNLDEALAKMTIGDSSPVTLENSNTKEEVKVNVTLKAIKEKQLPKADDELAKSVGAEFKTLEDLKKRLKEDLEKESENRAKNEHIDQVMEQIRKNNPIELPNYLVEQESQHMVDNLKNQLMQQGMAELPKDMDETKMKADFRADAEKRVHDQLLLDAISTEKKIEVSDADMESRLKEYAEASKVPVAELKAYYEKTNRLSSLRFQMLSEKTLDFLLGEAKIS